MSHKALCSSMIAAAAWVGCSAAEVGPDPVRDLNVVENTCRVLDDWATRFRAELTPFPERPTDTALALQPLEGGEQMRGGFGEILSDDIVRVEFLWDALPAYDCEGSRLGETFSLQCESVPVADETPDLCTVQLTPN